MNPSTGKEESAALADKPPEHAGGLSIAPIGAVFGASLGVVLAALLDLSAPLGIDAGGPSTWFGRAWVIGALAGAASGYVIGALISWELSDGTVSPAGKQNLDNGRRRSELPVALESPEQQDCSNSRGESNQH